MWIAQWPDGSWILYKGKPRLKMGGWDGEQVAIVARSLQLINWRETLKEVDPIEYGFKEVK